MPKANQSWKDVIIHVCTGRLNQCMTRHIAKQISLATLRQYFLAHPPWDG